MYRPRLVTSLSPLVIVVLGSALGSTQPRPATPSNQKSFLDTDMRQVFFQVLQFFLLIF